MNSMHRQFGRFMKRSPDESHVSVLLKDFDDADKLLARIIETSKAWRDAWSSILAYQCRLINEFEGLYAPIVGSSDSSTGHQPVATPEHILARTRRLNEEYNDLKRDLLVEVAAVDERMIKPATEAKDHLHSIKKVIKKREDKKLDFERYQSKVDSSRKKTKRSDRDNAVLAKAEIELTRATEEYNAADEHLRQRLPPLISVTFSLLPILLAAQIEIQNNLLAHYYTMLHNYCGEIDFPSPPPPMEQVTQDWERDHQPVRQEAETLIIIASGKAIRQPTNPDENRNGRSINGFGHRRPSNHSVPRGASVSPARTKIPPSPNMSSKPRLHHLPSNGNLAAQNAKMSPPSDSLSIPSTGLSPDPYQPQQTPVAAYSPAAPRTDYFSRDRQLSAASFSTTPGSSYGEAAAVKKKPPPPPPRAGSKGALFVTAMYDFGGQGAGDLVFKEGDRIRVLKKTDSTDDWWEGELRGVKGPFPANYCE